MGAVAIRTPKHRGRMRSMSGHVRLVAGRYTFPSSYVTGGTPLNLKATFPGIVQKPRAVFVQPRGGYVFAHDLAAGKVVALQQDATTGALKEVAAGTDLSTLGPLPVLAVGV